MKFVSLKPAPQGSSGISGILAVMSASPLVFTVRGSGSEFLSSNLAFAVASAAIFLLSSAVVDKHPRQGKNLAATAILLALAAMFNVLISAPAPFLAISSAFIWLSFYLYGFKASPNGTHRPKTEHALLQRCKYTSAALVLLAFFSYFITRARTPLNDAAMLASSLVVLGFALHWAVKQKKVFFKAAVFICAVFFAALLAALYKNGICEAGGAVVGCLLLLILPDDASEYSKENSYLSPILNHPGRLTLSTFILLCLFGSMLLSLPASAVRPISFIDAAFTSVSAVCVTGLTVLDTAKDFSVLGQIFILILIQLGGLSIMTITMVVIYAFGHRISLKQESAISAAYNANYQSLSAMLAGIVKYTAAVEGVGALILFFAFYRAGFSVLMAAFNAVFTSVSAFCNAGFALFSNNLAGFCSNSIILYTVSFLIILGGTAPITVLSFYRGVKAQSRIPTAVKLSLGVMAVLLLGSSFLFAVFEWNGALAGLSLVDKLNNSWFQAVTTRTAGFNSVVLDNISPPTLLMFIILMLIGGNPGGTAGGIKTSVVGVLFITFVCTASGDAEITFDKRKIRPQTVFEAATIAASALLLFLLTALMLITTQGIATPKLLFEAASALGTVGLSVGATAMLDAIGKVIVMLAMLLGRIGLLTVFTLFSHRPKEIESAYLEAEINLT